MKNATHLGQYAPIGMAAKVNGPYFFPICLNAEQYPVSPPKYILLVCPFTTQLHHNAYKEQIKTLCRSHFEDSETRNQAAVCIAVRVPGHKAKFSDKT